MSFYFYVYQRPLRVTIHRADCPYCREGQGMKRRGSSNKPGFWDGPHPNYETVHERALAHGDILRITPLNCRHCDPAKADNLAAHPEKKKIQPVTEPPQPVADEVKYEVRLKQLDKKHQLEQQTLLAFQNNIQRLMKSRHQAERQALEATTNDQDALSKLADQQKQQADELLHARTASYDELLEEQALEKSPFLNQA